MPRYIIEFSFDGSGYCGWQFQPDSKTIQQTLQEALGMLLHANVELTGCGRTDTGVHALYYAAHFDCDADIQENTLTERLNRLLKQEFCVFSVQQVAEAFHARFNALRREYTYYICNGKTPFFSKYSWEYHQKLDLQLMNDAAGLLIGKKNFGSFCKLHSNNKTNICEVYVAEWRCFGMFYVFTIYADRFLRNMVRAIVGTLVDVGRGRTSVDEFRTILAAENRCASGQSVPARGLFLTDVTYPDGDFIVHKGPSLPLLLL